jgi:hypothetical protein
MAAVSHVIWAKRMAEVHAELRRGLCAQPQRERSRSQKAMTAWKQKSRADAGRSRPQAGGAGRAQREP